jgi:hypothetical protein
VLVLRPEDFETQPAQPHTASASGAPAPVLNQAAVASTTISSRVSPRDADHSYNGIVFNVKTKGPHEVSITSIKASRKPARPP